MGKKKRQLTQRYIKQADRKLFILTGLTNVMRSEQNPVWLVPINLISHGTSVNKTQLLKNKWNPLLSGACLINLIHTRLPLTLFIKVIKNYLRHCICHFKYTTLDSIF